MSSGAVDTMTAEIRLDKENFESNCKDTLSMLQKLKAALKLDGASAGLKEIEKTSEKLDFKGLNNNIDGVGKHFSKLETIATGVLLKIGMSAAETGMRIAKSLTIDQVAAGWNKYAEKTTAVQTIMANLREDEGEFIDEAAKMEYVNGYLEKLMWFSDETSYRFVDMTSNVGKFIANGQNLKDSVTAMQGIATWAALSGQEAQAASRAMYNISQALGVGSMKIMDWKSIENANMATAQFKKLAITVGQEKGKIKEGQVTVENFRDSLSGKDTGGWFDNEVMMEVFRQYGEAADKIQAYSEKTGKIATEIIHDIRDGNKDIEKEVGVTADSLAFKAFEAAQQAKTFKEVVNATADAVSTKWMRIFENIFGNYLQAKELWTDLSEDLWNIFAGPLDTMGEIMELWNQGFFKNGPQNVLQRWFASGRLDKVENGLEYVSAATAELAVKSDEAHYKIETLEDGTRQLIKLVEEAPGKYKAFTKKIYEADKDLLSGRDLLIGGFKNILRTFIFDWKETNKQGEVIEHKSIFSTIKDALKEVVFGTSDMDKIIPMVSKKLWAMTKRFHELTERLVPSEETLGKIKNTFKGLFTVFKIGGKFFSPIIKQFNKLFGIGSSLKNGKRTLLDLADSMGTWVQELDKWLDKNKVFETVSKKVSGWFGKLKTGIDNLSIALTGLTVKNFSKKIINKVFGFFADLDFQKMFNNIGGFFTGIVTQVRQVITDDLPDELTPLQKFLVYAKKIFGGIKTFFKSIGPTLKTIGGKVSKAFTTVVNGITKAVKDIKDVATGNLPEELSPIQKFLLGFGKVFTFFKNSFVGIITSFPKLIERIRSFKLSDLKSLFSPIKNFWSSAKTFVRSAVDSAFGDDTTDGMSKAARRLAPIVRALKSIFEGLGNLFDSAAPYIEKAGKWIGEFLSNVGKNLDKFVGNKSGLEVLESLINLFKDFSLGKFFLSLAKLDKRFTKILKMFQKNIPETLNNISGSVKELLGNSQKGISGFFNRLLDYITNRKTVGKALIEDLESIRDIFKAYKREINAEALIDFAIAIGILAGSMWVLAQIPSEKLVSVGNAIAQIAGVVLILYTAGKLLGALGERTASKEEGNPIVAGIKDILTSTVKSSIFANDATAKFLKFAAGVALIALGIKMISRSMEDISNGIITLGKAYSDPNFKDGLKALGILAAGLALTSFVASIGGAGIFTSIATFVLFLLFIKKAKKLVGQITELGESTNGISFYKGLEYMGWLLAGIGAISLSAIALSYSNLLGVLGTLGLILVMTRFVRIVSKSLSELASSTDSNKIDAAADAINRLTYPLLAFALLTSVISRNKKARSAMGRAILAILAGTLMIRLIAKSLMNLADEKVDAERIKASASIITSIMTSVLITFGVLTLLSGLTGRFKTYVSYNGKAGAFLAALGFVGICFGIKMMAEALQDIASIGDETKISKAADVMTGLIIAVGVAQFILALVSGSNILGKSSGYSGILGTAFGIGGFIAMCYGIKMLVEALQAIASIGDATLIDKAADIIQRLTITVGATEAILTLIGGINIGAAGGPVAGAFSGTLGAIVGMAGFIAACYGIKKLAEALVMVSEAGNVGDIENAEQVIEKLIKIVRHTTELLGLMAGFNIGAILPGVGVGFLGSLGVPLGAWSFVQACNGIKVMAEAMTELSGISDSDLSETKLNSLEKVVDIAKSVFALKIGDFFLSSSGIKKTKADAFADVVQPIKELMSAISSISGEDYDPVAAENIVFRLQEVASIATDVFNADWFNSDKKIANIEAKAAAFGEVVDPIRTLLEAISTISGEGYDIDSAESVLSNLEDVVNMASKIFKADWFNNDDKSVAIATKADAFATTSKSIINLMYASSDLYASMEIPGMDAAAGAELGTGITAFIDEIVSAYTGSLAANSQTVYDAAIDLTDNVQSPIISAANDAYDWGVDLVSLFSSGIRAGGEYVTSAATYIADLVKGILGFSEPEKGPLSDFHTYAPDMIKLWNKGIYDNLGSVEESTSSVANSVYDGFSTALDYVSDLIDNGMSDQLTIRPVMDLSEIQNGMNSMSGMLSSADGYQITGTTRLAASAAYGVGIKPEIQQTPQFIQAESGPMNNTFYITNSDPNAVADKVSKILGNQTRRQKAVWGYK